MTIKNEYKMVFIRTQQLNQIELMCTKIVPLIVFYRSFLPYLVLFFFGFTVIVTFDFFFLISSLAPS